MCGCSDIDFVVSSLAVTTFKNEKKEKEAGNKKKEKKKAPEGKKNFSCSK
jgi:hypothetical protein